MGAVYLAEHPSIGRRVAIKVLRKELVGDSQHLTRFVNEARAANAIRHPNIVEILDAGTSETGVPYLVMELLEGESLSTRVNRRRIDLAEALEIVRQTASALHAAHRQGIVHRDLKPANLFLAVDGEGHERVKVLDFGIAKLQTVRPADQVRTETGQMLGTPTYMSPEQCLGIRHVGPRSDIYALGVILYEMVCGEPPFWSEAWGALVNMHVNQRPEPPRARVPELPAAVEQIILRMLAKNPDDRFDTMAELQTAVEAAAALIRGDAPALAARSVGTAAVGRARRSPTTLSGTTGEQGPRAGRPGRMGRWLGIALLAAAGTSAVYLVRARLHPSSALPVATGGTPAPRIDKAPAKTTSPVAPRKSVDPPRATNVQPRTVQLGIETDPPGARVVRASDGRRLGTTPFHGRFPSGAAPLELRLEREGYEPVRRLVPLTRDHDEVISLTPRPRTRVRPRTDPPAATEPVDEPAKL